MTKVADLVYVTDELLAGAAGWYGQLRLPSALAACHPQAIKVALRLAGGDPRRLFVDGAGGIVVANRPVWG